MTTTTSDTNLTQLVIHELTKAEYEALTPEANQLYLTPDESLTADDLKTINGTSIVGSGNISTSELPSQSGNSGKFLTTDGSAVSWATVDALPSQTSQSGKYLTTNGTTASWGTISIPSKISDLTDDTATYPIDKADTLTGLTASITELNYVDGVTSAIQTQLNNKQSSDTAVTHAASTAVGSGTQPVYIASDGTATATTYALNKTVPGDAVFTDTTYSAFVGATSGAAGTAGLVPAPSSGETSKYLKSDGTWAAVDSLPSQTSQSGKFLTTNGTTASWNNVSQLENQNSNENPVKVWTGTKAEYDEMGTYFAYTYGVTTVYVRKTTPTTSDTVYSAVGTVSALTISSVSTGSITLSDSNVYVRDDEEDIVDSTQYGSTTMYNIKDDTDTTLSLLDIIYPVGSIYIGTMNACPLQSIGLGTWQLVATDRVLQGAGTRGSVGSTVNESLPNITGGIDTVRDGVSFTGTSTGSGALFNASTASNVGGGTTGMGTQVTGIKIDASRSSSTYRDNAPVQQDAYLVNIWERIS